VKIFKYSKYSSLIKGISFTLDCQKATTKEGLHVMALTHDFLEIITKKFMRDSKMDLTSFMSTNCTIKSMSCSAMSTNLRTSTGCSVSGS